MPATGRRTHPKPAFELTARRLQVGSRVDKMIE